MSEDTENPTSFIVHANTKLENARREERIKEKYSICYHWYAGTGSHAYFLTNSYNISECEAIRNDVKSLSYQEIKEYACKLKQPAALVFIDGEFQTIALF
jgi:hypothetical protein